LIHDVRVVLYEKFCITFNMPHTIRIATRKSPLALWQAHHVGNLLQTHWPELRISYLPMTTSGDTFLSSQELPQEGKSAFVKELEHALIADEADIAVHSMKDVPVKLPHGLDIHAILPRHDPRDALLSVHYDTIKTLPKQARIGTISVRRQAQLLMLAPHLQCLPLRGNIDSRIRKLEAGEYDAIVLAYAGVQRLELEQHVKHIFSTQDIVPACGQGALGIECRSSDERVRNYISVLNDARASTCVHIEREMNRLLGGHCHTPIGIYAEYIDENNIRLHTRVCDIKTGKSIEHIHTDQQSSLLIQKSITALEKQGVYDILKP
jgi:hydroxymethylbilane synthase